ncbi:MAG: hypothetical protein ACRYGP_27975 [Janthinobacterium lividum]
MSDRIYPIIALNRIKNYFSYYVLAQPPSANITIGSDGLLFLNGTDAEHENNLVDNSCVQAAQPGSLQRFEAALARIAEFGGSRGYPIDVLMVPTIPVLYGDRLPRSLPSSYREACAAIFARQGAVSAIQAPAGMRFIYPFAELAALRDDPAMYPNGAYHAVGLGVRRATETYLQAIGHATSKTSLTLTKDWSEALESRDMQVAFPRYTADLTEVSPDDEAIEALTKATLPYRDNPGQTIVMYRNDAAPNPETVLVLSDSFGTNQALDLSSAFRGVIQMQTPHRDTAGMIDAIRNIVPFDRIILVFNDTNLARLSEFGENLSMSAGR